MNKLTLKRLFKLSLLVIILLNISSCASKPIEKDYDIIDYDILDYSYNRYLDSIEDDLITLEEDKQVEISNNFLRDLANNDIYFSYKSDDFYLVNIPHQGLFIKYINEFGYSYIFQNSEATYKYEKLCFNDKALENVVYYENNGNSFNDRFKRIYETNSYNGLSLSKRMTNKGILKIQYSKDCYSNEILNSVFYDPGFNLSFKLINKGFSFSLLGSYSPIPIDGFNLSFDELDIRSDINEFNKIKSFKNASIDTLAMEEKNIAGYRELADKESISFPEGIKASIKENTIATSKYSLFNFFLTLTKNPASYYANTSDYYLLSLNFNVDLKIKELKASLNFKIKNNFYFKEENIKKEAKDNGLIYIEIALDANDIIFLSDENELYWKGDFYSHSKSKYNSVINKEAFNGKIKISALYNKEYNKYLNSNVLIENSSKNSIKYQLIINPDKKIEIKLHKQNDNFYLPDEVIINEANNRGVDFYSSFLSFSKIYDKPDFGWYE